MPARPRTMPPVGKSGPGDEAHQLVDGDVGIVDIGDAGVDDLAQIVGRHIGRHADGDAAGAIDQEIGKARRQDGRLDRGVVVIGLVVDGILVDVVEQRRGGARQPGLGIAHGRRRIAVHRAEIALAVDQRQAHGEILRHADHGVVDRRVAMGMILAHDVADRAGRFALGVRFHSFPASRMAKRMRRCTGFRPSRTSGSARATITLMA